MRESGKSILIALGRRPFVAALLLYQALFLNVLVPGHTRGQITTSSDSSCSSCCASETSDSKRNDGKPTERDKINCAVCYFVARMTPVAFVSLTLPELGLLRLLPTPPPAAVESDEFVPTYLGRGPPAVDHIA